MWIVISKVHLTMQWAIYFDSFGIEHILKEIKKFIGIKNNITIIYRIEACDMIKRGYFYIGFILWWDYNTNGKKM